MTDRHTDTQTEFPLEGSTPSVEGVEEKRPKYGFSAHKTAADFNNHLLRVYPSGYS